MSRVAKKPVPVPAKVSIEMVGRDIKVKGPKGELTHALHAKVAMKQEGSELLFSPAEEGQDAWAQAGTARAVVSNMVTGVSTGFQRKLNLVGVGYRAAAKGNVLSLSLGFSHPVDYQIPQGITAETPSQTEIVISGSDKQRVGQVAAEIRAYRPPEPYKGKGVRYSDEVVLRKEAKKK
jgi:large subunit ribosomal protein L6